MTTVHQRLDSLHERQQETLDGQQAVIEEQRELIAVLRDRLAVLERRSGETGGSGRELPISRRSALIAGGTLALLGAVGGTASAADPTGRVGTGNQPLETLYAGTLAGPLTGNEPLENLVGEGLELAGGALTVVPGGPNLEEPDDRSAVLDRMDQDGDGTYVVTNDHELQAMNADLGADYRLGNDIDARPTGFWYGGAGFDPVGGDAGFEGGFDGDGHVIEGLTIDRDDEENVGLFGQTNGGTVENVGLENVAITGEETVGGLVGNNNGDVNESYVAGAVTGTGFFGVGGLVGRNDGDVSRSYVFGDVTGVEEVGGLVGRNNIGTVNESFATCNVLGRIPDSPHLSPPPVGGLIGNNSGDVNGSYWDITISDHLDADDGVGEGDDTGVTGLETAEMQGDDLDANLESDFDFDAVWATVTDPDDYPVLQAIDEQTQLEARQ